MRHRNRDHRQFQGRAPIAKDVQHASYHVTPESCDAPFRAALHLP